MSEMLERAKQALHDAERERDLLTVAELEARPDDWGTHLARAALLAALDPEDEAMVEAIARALWLDGPGQGYGEQYRLGIWDGSSSYAKLLPEDSRQYRKNEDDYEMHTLHGRNYFRQQARAALSSLRQLAQGLQGGSAGSASASHAAGLRGTS